MTEIFFSAAALSTDYVEITVLTARIGSKHVRPSPQELAQSTKLSGAPGSTVCPFVALIDYGERVGFVALIDYGERVGFVTKSANREK